VVREEIKRNVQTYNFSVEIAEDEEALRAFQNIQGVVAFKATLRRNSQIYGFGYGMALINETNKYFSKQIAFASNSALIDSVVKASKLIDILPSNFNAQQEPKELPSSLYKIEQTNNFQPASEKQIKFLERLLRDNQASKKEIESIYLLSKKEAASKISFLMPTK
jgi:DNA uptake protein ComE-like DNA-binding protein